jgi:hypothetical protein
MRSNANPSSIARARAFGVRLMIGCVIACSFVATMPGVSSAGGPVPVTGRSITLVLGGHVVVTGRVSGPDRQHPARPRACTEGVPVQLQRRRAEGWATIKERDTGSDRRFHIRAPDRQGVYRVTAPEVDAGSVLCAAVTASPLRHRH